MEAIKLRSLTLLLMVAVSIFLVAAQVNLKKSLVLLANGINFESVFLYLFSYRFSLSIFFVFLAFVVWMYVLSYEDLHLAYPLMSISYLFMYAYSHYFLNQPFVLLHFIGIIFITLGVFMVYLDVK